MNPHDAARPARLGWWPFALVGGALVFVVGGALHPQQDDPALSEAANLAAWIGNPMWIPSHALIVVSSILFALGLIGLVAHRPWLSTGARRAGWLAAAGAALSVVEGVPHMLAGTESTAAAAGGSTPFLSAHMVASLLAYPLFGWSVASLAVLGRRTLAHPAVTAAAVVGGVGWGIAPWAVGPLGIEPAALLFPVGVVLMSGWFAVVGVRAAVVTRRGVAPTGSAA